MRYLHESHSGAKYKTFCRTSHNSKAMSPVTCSSLSAILTSCMYFCIHPQIQLYWYLLQSMCLLQGWSHKRAVDFDSLVDHKLSPILELCCLLKFTMLFYSPVASTLINSWRSVSLNCERIVLFIEPSTCPFLQKLASVLHTFSSPKQRIPTLTPFFGNIFSLHYSLCYLCYFVFLIWLLHMMSILEMNNCCQH